MGKDNSIPDLERRLGCEGKFKELAEEFDMVCPEFNSSLRPSDALGTIKIFLRERKKFRYSLFEGTKLKGSDCLTMAVLAASIADRKGYSVEICRPDCISEYLHAALAYSEGGQEKTFSVAGKSEGFHPVMLDNDSVMMRLRITKPIVDFINRYIRGVYK